MVLGGTEGGVGNVRIGCWQISGQVQVFQLQTAGGTNAWSLQNDEVRYFAGITIHSQLDFVLTNVEDASDEDGETFYRCFPATEKRYQNRNPHVRVNFCW